jgi:tetratricopeptide (TPR) repeat protein
MRALFIAFAIILLPLITFGQSAISTDTLLVEEYYHPFDSTLTEVENKQQAINIAFLNAIENAFGKIVVSTNDMNISNSNESNKSTSSTIFKSRTKSLVQGKVSKVLELIFEKRTLEKYKNINGERIKTKILYDYVKVRFIAKEAEQPIVFEQEIDQISKQVDLLNVKVEQNTKDINQIKEETEISVVDPIETAFKFYDEKKFNQAIKYFKIGLNRVRNYNFGNKYAYYYFLADSYINQGDYNNSIIYSDSLILLNPLEPAAISFKTAALFLSGKPNEGIFLINTFLSKVGSPNVSKSDTLLDALTKFSKLNSEIVFKGLEIETTVGTISFDQKIRNSNYKEELSGKRIRFIHSANRKLNQLLTDYEIINDITHYLLNSESNLSLAANFILEIKLAREKNDIFQTITQNRKIKELSLWGYGEVDDSIQLKREPENRWVIANNGKEFRGPVYEFNKIQNYFGKGIDQTGPLGERPFERGVYSSLNVINDSVNVIECPCEVLIKRGIYDELNSYSGTINITNYSQSEQIFNSAWLYLMAGDFKSSINLYSSVVKYFIKLGRQVTHSRFLKFSEKQNHNMAIINLAHSYLLNGNYEEAAKEYNNVYIVDFDEKFENHSSNGIIKSDWADFVSKKLISQKTIDEFNLKYLAKFFERN